MATATGAGGGKEVTRAHSKARACESVMGQGWKGEAFGPRECAHENHVSDMDFNSGSIPSLAPPNPGWLHS